MMTVQTNAEKIRNALEQLAYYEDLPHDCPLFVQGPDGTFYELLANSSETGSDETEQLALGHLRALFQNGPEGMEWSEVWAKFEAGLSQ